MSHSFWTKSTFCLPYSNEKWAEATKERKQRIAVFHNNIFTWVSAWTENVDHTTSNVVSNDLRCFWAIRPTYERPVCTCGLYVQVHKEAGLYLTLFGLLMGFLSTFWAFGYTRLAAKLRQGVQDPEQTPPRAEVLKSLSSGITINLVGLASTLFGLEATCGLLFAKSLAFAASNPYTISQSNPVQALDIFVVQASANTLLSHFIALCFSLWLLRMITFGSESPPTISESTSTWRSQTLKVGRYINSVAHKWTDSEKPLHDLFGVCLEQYSRPSFGSCSCCIVDESLVLESQIGMHCTYLMARQVH